MATIVLVSASGSPGVSASALGLALTWPRPVLLVEADPTGGSAFLAGYFRGGTAPGSGLVDLAWAHRHGALAATLPQVLVPVPGSSVSLLPGVRAHGQSRSVAGLWEPLAEELAAWGDRSGEDVIVDAGRLGLAGFAEPLLDAADLALVTVRSDLVALSAARSWAETLRAGFAARGAGQRLGVLLVGEGRPYRRGEVANVLQVPVVAAVAFDPASAAVFAYGAPPPRRFDRSALPRSLRAARVAIEAALAATTAALGATGRGTVGVDAAAAGGGR